MHLFIVDIAIVGIFRDFSQAVPDNKLQVQRPTTNGVNSLFIRLVPLFICL
jgi:hypothetical protein